MTKTYTREQVGGIVWWVFQRLKGNPYRTEADRQDVRQQLDILWNEEDRPRSPIEQAILEDLTKLLNDYHD